MTRFKTIISSPSDDHDVEVTLATEGDEIAMESVHMHVHDAAVRAMQALIEERPPDECEGYIDIDWDQRFEMGREVEQ